MRRSRAHVPMSVAVAASVFVATCASADELPDRAGARHSPWGGDRTFEPPRGLDPEASGDNAFSQVQLGLGDLAVVAGAGGFTLALHAFHTPSPSGFETPGADQYLRGAVRLSDGGALGTSSDYLMAGLVAGAIAAPLLASGRFDRDEVNAAAVTAEAILTASALTSVAKHAIGRSRPGNAADAADGTQSFFSGHTSAAFAAATMLTISAYELSWLDEDTRWLVPAIGYSLAGTVGYLRMASDQHWGTDVLAGAAVGTLSSLLVFKLRTDWL